MTLSELSYVVHERYRDLNIQAYLYGDYMLEIPSKLIGKKLELHRDVIGQDVKAGDVVSFSNGRDVNTGILIGFTPNGFRIMQFNRFQAYYKDACKLYTIGVWRSVALVKALNPVIVEA